MKSENKNFIYNVVYQLLIYVFPLVTIPYVSRVLGVDNIGIYSYTYSIVYVFLLIALLGINNYGCRSIAQCRDNKDELSRQFISIYSFQLISSSISILAYIIFIATSDTKYTLISALQLIYLISVLFDINWFYFGLEKFKVTITRNLIVKVLSVICIFLFVKRRSDLWVYTLIMASAMLLSQLYLFTILHRFVFFVKVKVSDIFSNAKEIFVLFIPVIAFAVYRVMDKTMIGYFSSVTELGYYENAERIINIPISIIVALGTVMLPRMSYLIKTDSESANNTINSSMKLALILASIMAIGAFAISEDISLLLFGPEFYKSGNIIKALAFTIIASAWANVIRTQYLIPRGKDNVYVASTIFGAIINLISNFIFIPIWGAYGACIGTLFAEFSVAIYQTIAVKKELPISKYLSFLSNGILTSIVIMAIVSIICFSIDNIIIRFGIELTLAIVLFFIFNRNYIKNEFLK